MEFEICSKLFGYFLLLCAFQPILTFCIHEHTVASANKQANATSIQITFPKVPFVWVSYKFTNFISWSYLDIWSNIYDNIWMIATPVQNGRKKSYNGHLLWQQLLGWLKTASGQSKFSYPVKFATLIKIYRAEKSLKYSSNLQKKSICKFKCLMH